MDEQTINRKLHEAMGGEVYRDISTEERNAIYERTGGSFGRDPDAYGMAVQAAEKVSIPDYCASLDAVSEVEAFVIEKVGAFVYAETLCADLLGDEPGDLSHETTLIRCLTATAKQRATACLKALEQK